MTKKGILDTSQQKARLAEILIREHFGNIEKVVDLSGKNCNSPFDGICPKNQIYDVKSSKLYDKFNCHYWHFHFIMFAKMKLNGTIY